MAMAASIVVVSLILAAFILQSLFVANLERSVKGDLEAALSRLVALIDPTAAQPAISAPLPDPRYDTPLSGRYWQIEDLDSGEIARSRSLFDVQLVNLQPRDGGTFHFTGPNDFHLILVSKAIELGSRHFRVTVGQDHNEIHAAGIQFAWEIGRLFSLLGLVILALGWAQLWLGLRPLNRLRDAVDTVRRGDIDQLTGRFPSEIEPLVDEVNALLVERQALAERARRRASDLAHGLKTPLAALQGIAMRLHDRGETSDAGALDDLAFEMSNRVDYQMRLASLRTRSPDHRESSQLNSAILRTMSVLRKTSGGELLHWMAELSEDLHVDIHRQDLMELMGVTLENAAKWASTKVVVYTARQATTAIIRIADDGPGLTPNLISRLGNRGIRHDESVPGSGLGLAIATEILELNRGSIRYNISDMGGLMVEIRLPVAIR